MATAGTIRAVPHPHFEPTTRTTLTSQTSTDTSDYQHNSIPDPPPTLTDEHAGMRSAAGAANMRWHIQRSESGPLRPILSNMTEPTYRAPAFLKVVPSNDECGLKAVSTNAS
jgi:hypothetical protein